MTKNIITEQPISVDVLREKYMKPGDTSVDDVFRRVAKALASVEKEDMRDHWEQQFYENMKAGAIGAGRIMSAAGTGIQATLINCFVQPVGDCIQGFDDAGYPGIYEALREAAETMRRGGGVGYDFSRIRPRGAVVKATHSVASGPCSYIDVFDKSCATVESAGARRGAQMGILRIDHPDVLEFITAKRTPGRWNNFNVSVGVTDAFMKAVQANGPWGLVHAAEPGEDLKRGGADHNGTTWVYKTVAARELWDTIMRSAYDFAEPGIFFLDNVNRDNNLNYCETIECCNPCGEQPLPPYGCCDLGPIILPRFVTNPFDIGGFAKFDFRAFEVAVGNQVRALDNVLDVTYWPLKQQHEESQKKRRIGVGFTGLGDTLAMMKLRYDSAGGRSLAMAIAKTMRDAAYRASMLLAKEKGPFPLFDPDKYLADGTFASRLEGPLKMWIREFGIRNSHLLSIAPTGTVSLAFADNVSNGIEPPYSWTYERKKREGDGSYSTYQVQDHAWRLYGQCGGDTSKLPDYFVTALDMSVDGHLEMMGAVQPFIDTAISKTVNIPADYPYEDFKKLYMRAWELGLKGMATYRPNTILGSVLSTTPAPAPEVIKVQAFADVVKQDPMRAVIVKRPHGQLPAVVEKVEYWTQQGRQTVYIVVSFTQLEDGRERAIEFFMPVGQSGESQQWISSSMRLLSLAARGGFLERTLVDMRKVAWDRGPVRLGTYTKADGGQVPLWHDSEVAAIAYAIQNIIERRGGKPAPELVTPAAVAAPAMAGAKCPECGAYAMVRKDGCDFCTACGHVGSCG
jgi:ribonucleoside-diphosphate reductase alpha chain